MMMQDRKIWNIVCGTALMLATIILCSCTKTLELPASSKERKIVLLGELIADDSISIRGAQSLSISTSNSKFELPEGLMVTLEDGGGNNIPLLGRKDDLSERLFSIPFQSVEKAQANTRYKITATHPAMGTATADVAIPSPISVRVTDTASVIYQLDNTLRISLEITDKGSEKNFYVIEALRQQGFQNVIWVDGAYRYDTFYNDTYIRSSIYTNDAFAENVTTTTGSSSGTRILFSDVSFDGKVHKTDVFVTKTQVYDTTSIEKTIFIVKSVSEDYYNFLKAYEQYEPLSGFNTNSAPVKLDGNVKNGLGMIGGVSQKKFYYNLAYPLF